MPFRPCRGTGTEREMGSRDPLCKHGAGAHLRGIMTPDRMTPEEIKRARLRVLREEHRDLDESIRALEADSGADPLTIRRLKKRKLALRDAIARLEDDLTPDIIA